MTTEAPERIWAVTEEDDISADILGEVYAQQVPDGMVGKPVKYIRADIADEMLEALKAAQSLHQRYCDRVGAADGWARSLKSQIDAAIDKA